MTDKQKHFLVNLIAMIAASVGSWMLGVEYIPSILVGTALCSGLSVGKEYGDSQAQRNRWDWWDILADFLGYLVGLLVFTTIHKLLIIQVR